MKRISHTATSVAFAAALAVLSCGDSGTSPPSDGPDDDLGELVVLAWNDLGMHCLNPTYDQAVILPPYNNLWALVIERGDPPRMVTGGLTLEYTIENNTYSYGKRDYAQFWDYGVDLFGNLFGITTLPRDSGLLGNGLAGEMEARGVGFVAEGVPVTPVDDDGVWNPYQAALVTVKESQGKKLFTTRATVPTSDEINCSRCHGMDPFKDMLEEHDEEHQTDLSGSMPVLCADCHGTPALGQATPGSSGSYLSRAIHGSHADRRAACYDCHPGPQTGCNRSLSHTGPGGNCITCHGDMGVVAGSIEGGRMPWAEEPSCVTCHEDVSGVETGPVLYRNAVGHGEIHCIACHGSPHAMIPSREASDNYLVVQFTGSESRVKPLGSCGVCHASSRGRESDIGEFDEVHGGQDPELATACNICHTSVTYDPDKWPHAYEWKDSN